ncbi:MAG: hypothetical protein DRJ44_00300 [Thermoprotei archaeon]|nr:MAG: hypothetical protein DRJ44_00300 [Thermoprotei archaeon]
MRRVEKRLRIRRMPSIPPGQVRINPKTMEYLGIDDEVEIVVARKKRLVFKAYSLDEVPENEVWGNEEELRTHGIADYTIATCRAPLKSQEVV